MDIENTRNSVDKIADRITKIERDFEIKELNDLHITQNMNSSYENLYELITKLSESVVTLTDTLNNPINGLVVTLRETVKNIHETTELTKKIDERYARELTSSEEKITAQALKIATIEAKISDLDQAKVVYRNVGVGVIITLLGAIAKSLWDTYIK